MYLILLPLSVTLFGLYVFLPAGALYDQTTFLTMAIAAADANDMHGTHTARRNTQRCRPGAIQQGYFPLPFVMFFFICVFWYYIAYSFCSLQVRERSVFL